MIATKKSYEAPNVQLIQFDGNDVIATSGTWFNCTSGWGGDYGLDDYDTCETWAVTDNSMGTPLPPSP